MIDKYQLKDKELVAKLKSANYHTKYFHGGGIVTHLICRSDKTVIPKILRKCVVNWYKTYIIHPRMDCTDTSISQPYYWPNLREDIRTNIKVCMNFYKNKKQS